MSHQAYQSLWGKGQVKEMHLELFLEGSNWNIWTDTQREVVPKRWSTRVKNSCTCVGLDPRDWQSNTFVLSQWMGWEWCGEHGVQINKLVFMQGIVSQQTSEHSGDHRSLWQAFNKILHRCPKMYLPDHSSITALANTFSSFFINKISIIRSFFSSGSCSNVLTPPNTREVLHNLSHVTDAEVRRLVLSAPCKSSDLDPLPTGLVKDCIDVLVTPIVSIVNLSLSEGCFPTHFKSALVSPLLKKPTLNRDDMKNYRPVSNLSFLSKILEKVVASRLNSHINSSHTSNDYQSAYRKFHSTETTLLKIHNDILSSMDDGRVTALTLLLDCHFSSITFTEIKQRNHSVHP